jgi:teichoic acid transport system ATP-binding protein
LDNNSSNHVVWLPSAYAFTQTLCGFDLGGDGMNKVSVKIQALTKQYSIYHGPKAILKAFLFSRGGSSELFIALEDINAQFYTGERIGLVGFNGSGKSTLSSLIAGITEPTSGMIEVNGDVSMLSTNAGLITALTGRENIYFKCLLLGFSHEHIKEMEQPIISFADIGMFIDQPLRVYSSGMKSRLGFAISAQISPEILVIDEALSVGDESFADKCKERMEQFSKEGKTIIFVSHSNLQMRTFCNRIMWLHRGKQIAFGNAAEIMNAYSCFSKRFSSMPLEHRKNLVPVYEDYCK